MLILRSFFESVFLFVKSLAVKVTKLMYRSSSVIVTGAMAVSYTHLDVYKRQR